MFPFSKKKDKSVKELLSAAYTVYNYRRDAVAPEDAEKLRELIEKVEELFDGGKTAKDEFKKACADLKETMKKCGGMLYPMGFWTDNIDVVFVAGILALSLRSFFFQPFQIPTNSMYPSFYGMTEKVYAQGEDEPSFRQKAWRLITKKASNYELNAARNGEVFIRINRPNQMEANGGIFYGKIRPSRWLGVLPSQEKVYEFLSGGQKLELAVPAEYSLDSAMRKAYPFMAQGSELNEYLNALHTRGKIVEMEGKLYLSLGEKKKGERILNFDILGGDMLFVDRFTYNFRKPKVGEPIVFKTGMCPGITAQNGGVPDDKYYIKRLAGAGGDTLKVEGSALMRNGEPATGAQAFKFNAEQTNGYCGYKPYGAFENGGSVSVPQNCYYAMGDNSANSLDSRYWGFVPDKAVVGKALVIFYPFTERWGAAK
ncbi:MAG: signal peptidase I [Opitutales bacterium]|nr:signal peptidase I [Opitutales bacterium]